MTEAPAPELLKLYNLPQRTENGIPIHGAKAQDSGEDIVLLFHHLDGMYSYCTVQDPEAPNDKTGKVVHLSASTPLVYEDGKYRIDGGA